jgi:formylglycine-generating enzyme required for sulfatase activity
MELCLNIFVPKEKKMKKLTIVLFMVILAAFLIQAETIANVTSQKGLTLTIDRGSVDGVQVGMKGVVKAIYKEPGGEYTINIGIFTVRKALERTAEVTIEIGKGLNPADARYVVFEQNLVPAESKVGEAEPAEAAETPDWHLEQGDKDADAENFKAALEHYQKAMKLDPGNLVAKEKCSEMKKKIAASERSGKFHDYLKKADANYEKNDVKFAFLYLIEALRTYPEGQPEVGERLAVISHEHSKELAAILNEKSEELKDVRPLIDSMLTAKAAPEEVPSETSEPAPKPTDAFLSKIRPKAERIARNEKGFWEAVFPNNITMVYIPEGEFTIGSPVGEGDADEHPAHKVRLAGFWIGKTEVTFGQYDRFCAETGRESAADEGWGRGNRPVIYVSWNDARDFCSWLGKKTGLKFRLPSEAEWEKAARDLYPWGTHSPDATLANCNKDNMKTRPVGSYPLGASPYGVLDLAGNVWEWMADWYDPGFYQKSPRENPQGPETGSERVVRGGCWANGPDLVRSANRSQENAESKLNILGFRLALDGN